MQGGYRLKSQYINGLIHFLPLCSISNSPGNRVALMGLANIFLFSFEEQKQQKGQDTQASRDTEIETRLFYGASSNKH